MWQRMDKMHLWKALSLVQHFTLTSILSPSLSGEFFTRMFSSFKSLCTISVGCEEMGNFTRT